MRPKILCVMIPAMMVAQLVAGQTQDDRAVDSVDLSVHASVDQEGREPQALQNAPIQPTTLSRWSYQPVRPSATPRVGPSQEGVSGASGSEEGNTSPLFGISRLAGRLVRPESTTTAVHEKTATPNSASPPNDHTVSTFCIVTAPTTHQRLRWSRRGLPRRDL